jgi:ubiquinone/menaquinone biosynthesis C-methylase UbiE
MNSLENETNYWIEFWNNNPIIDDEDFQKQIGRTINKVPINKDVWELTVAEIIRIIKLDHDDELIDICAGNGLLAVPFAQRCIHVTAVDVSKKLLDRIDTTIYKNITVIEGDVRNIQFEKESFTKAVLYFALQHFTERETILLFKSVYNWLKQDGLFYVGDILDVDEMFIYYRTPEWQSEYFESILSRKPIGTWYKKSFLEKLAFYAGFKKCEFIAQPAFQINSHYRLDILLQK